MASFETSNTLVQADDLVNCNDPRTSFALAMSATYKREAPLYGDLTRVVSTVKEETNANSSELEMMRMRNGNVAAERLNLERQ